MLSTVLLVLAFVLFVVAALGIAASRFNLIAAGLACYVAAQIFGPLVR